MPEFAPKNPTGRRGFLEPWLALGAAAFFSLPLLVNTWLGSPLDRVGGFLFLAWILCLFAVPSLRLQSDGNRRLAWISLSLLFLGSLIELNALRLLALPLAAAAFLREPFRFPVVCWMGASLAWMPVSTWLLAKVIDAPEIPWGKLAWLIAGVLPAAVGIRDPKDRGNPRRIAPIPPVDPSLPGEEPAPVPVRTDRN